MKKNIIAALAILSFIPLSTFAQTEVQNPAEVYVQDLSLTGLQAKAGEVVQGSFSLVNTRNEPVSGLYYHILLMQRDQNGGLKTYDDVSFGPESLTANQRKTLPLSYTVPSTVSGPVVIRVRAVLTSGFKMGWKDANFTITGGATTQNLVVEDARIIVNEKEFAVAAGPTIYPADKAYYSLTLKNSSATSVVVTPHLSFYKKDVTGSPMIATTSDAVMIAAGSTRKISLNLPSGFQPDSYEVKVELKNQKGGLVAPLLGFRYLIGGDILTIQSVTSETKTFRSGKPVVLSIHYTGTPADLTGRETPPIGQASVSIVLRNEKGDLVGSSTEEMQFDVALGVLPVTVTSTGSAKGYSALIIVTKADKVLASFDTKISDQDLPGRSPSLPVVLALILGLGILVVVGLIWKKTRKPALMLFAVALSMGIYFASPSQAAAFTVTDSFNVSRTIFTGQNWRPSVFVNNPYGTIQPGQQFFLEMDVEILACHNKPSYITYQVKDWNSSNYTDMGQVNRGADNTIEHYSYSYTDTVKCGTGGSGKCVSDVSGTSPGIMFTAPSAPGTYRIYFRILNDPHISTIVVDPANPLTFTHTPLVGDNTVAGSHELNYGWVEGYQEFTVEAPPTSLANYGDLYVERVISGGTAVGTQARLGPYVREGVRYNFSNIISNNVPDISGNGGTAFATSTVIISGADIPPGIGGSSLTSSPQALSAAYGGGPDGYGLYIPDDTLKGARTGTISMWVRWNGNQQCAGSLCGMVFARQPFPNSSGPTNAVIALDNTDPAAAHLYWQAFSAAGVKSTVTVGSGWHHIVATFDSRTGTVYLDGVQVATQTFGTDQQMDTGDRATGIGRYEAGGYQYSSTTVADVRIYPRALSSSEVSTLKTGGDVPFSPQWVTANPAKFSYVPISAGAGRIYSANVSPDLTFDYNLTIGWCMFDKNSATDCTPTNYVPRSNYTSELCNSLSCSVPVTMYPNWGPGTCNTSSTSVICSQQSYVTKVSYKYTKKPAAVTTKTYCNLMVNNGLGWTADYFNYPQSYEADWWYGHGWYLFNDGTAKHPKQAGFGNWYDKTSPYYTGGVGFTVQETSLVHGWGDSRNGNYENAFSPAQFLPFPDNSFGVHWTGYVSTSTAGTYAYTFSNTDDDVWMYVDGVLQTFNGQPWPGSPGVKGFTTYTGSIALQANVPRLVEIYYGQRAATGSGFNFVFDINKNGVDSKGNPTEAPCTTVTNRGLLIRKVGPTGSELEVPIRTISGAYTGGNVRVDSTTVDLATAGNSAVLQWAPNLVSGGHTIAAQSLGGYNVSIGACKYPAVTADFTPSSECALTNADMASTTCSLGWCTPQSGTGDPTKDFRIKKISGTYENYPSTSFVEDGQVTKVIFKYTPVPLPAITASCSGVPTFAVGNLTTTWTAIASGGAGAGTYSYQWNERIPSGNSGEGLPPVTWSVGQATGTDATTTISKYVYDPSQMGLNLYIQPEQTQQKQIQVTVSSSSATPKTVVCNSAYLNPSAPAQPPVSLSCSPSKTNVFVGQNVTWTVTGGPVGAKYKWGWGGGNPSNQNPSGCTDQYDSTCSSVATQYPSSGKKTAVVSLEGTTGVVSCTSGVNVTNFPVYEQF